MINTLIYQRYYFSCDRCGERQESEYQHIEDARDKVEQEGFVISDNMLKVDRYSVARQTCFCDDCVAILKARGRTNGVPDSQDQKG